MAQQTAINFLLEKIKNLNVVNAQGANLVELYIIIQQAKAIEKEQIIEAAGTSCQYMCYNDRRSAEQYYNETYNK
jgi:hypothetical protein